MKLDDFVTASQLDVLYRSTGDARGLPGAVYGEAFYQLENEKLFPYTWTAVAVGGDLPDPGDVYPVMLGDWPVLLVRTKHGEINGFLNICRHRNMRVVKEHGKNRQLLSCPWHCWTYDLDGNLVSTPNVQGPEQNQLPPGWQADELSLHAVRIGVWNDVIFVNIKGGVSDFQEHLKPLDDLVANYALDEAEYAGRYDHYYKGNWKVVVEGGLEEYHLPWGHPHLITGTTAIRDHSFSHARCYTGTYFQADLAEDSKMPDEWGISTLPPLYKRRTDEIAGSFHTWIINVFPTVVVALSGEHVVYALHLPDGPEGTRVVFNYYFHGNAARDPAFAEARRRIKESWEVVAPQDDDYVQYVHANRKASKLADLEPARFSPYWEGGVHGFQKIVVETVQEVERSFVR